MSADALRMLHTFSAQMPALWELLLWIGYLIGLFMVIAGLIHGGSQDLRARFNHGAGYVISMIIAGSFLLSGTTWADIITHSFLPEASVREIVAAVPIDQANPGRTIVQTLANLAALIGLVSVGRGVYLWGVAGSKRLDGFWQGTAAVFIGAALLNVITVLKVFGMSFGLDSVVNVFAPLAQ